MTINFYYFFCSTDSIEILSWIIYLYLQNFCSWKSMQDLTFSVITKNTAQMT